ncbi:MAG: hypothetical protein ACRCYZ_00235 [Alphaproteobacteria bacterium]
MSKKYTFFLLVITLFFVSFPGMSVKSHREEGELDRQINFLKSLKQSGEKLGLVIGRSSIEQSVFSSNQEKIIWSYESLPYREDMVEKTALKLNFNLSDLKDIRQLENLFYVVIVDRFSWNFLQDQPIDFMVCYSKLLEKNPQSRIFFEAVPTMIFLNNKNEEDVYYSSYSYKIPLSWFSCTQSGSRMFDLMRLTLEKNMLFRMQNHLKGLFQSVTIKDLVVYDLLQTHENEPTNQINSKFFFVLKQPIHAQDEL